MKSFGHCRPVRDESGSIVGSKPSPAKVRTIDTLGSAHGIDRDKRLILTAHANDMIGLRPERTKRELFIVAKDLYAYMVRCAANRVTLEKARERKSKKADRLARQRQERAEKRLFKQ